MKIVYSNKNKKYLNNVSAYQPVYWFTHCIIREVKIIFLINLKKKFLYLRQFYYDVSQYKKSKFLEISPQYTHAKIL